MVKQLLNRYNRLKELETASSFSIVGDGKTLAIDPESSLGIKIKSFVTKEKLSVLVEFKEAVVSL